ncbi:MAG TPA: hypothetical protein VGC27_13075, partial [Rhizomicrobium sp.]
MSSRPLLVFSLLAALTLACNKVPENTVVAKRQATPQENRKFEQLALEARGAFLKEPRDIGTVETSARKYAEATAIRANDYVVMWEAARS